MAKPTILSLAALICAAVFSAALAQQGDVPGLKGPITQSRDQAGGVVYSIPGFDTPPGHHCSRPQTAYGRQQLESALRFCVSAYNQLTVDVKKQWQERRKSAGPQQKFCDNFAEHRKRLLGLLAQRKGEANPLRARDIDAQIGSALAASRELEKRYGDGFTEFESFVVTVTGLEDRGFNRIGLSGSMACADAPIVIDALFSNEPIQDPPNPNDLGLLSSLAPLKSILSQLNRGDRITVSGLFRKFDVGSSMSSISLSAGQIILRVRVTALSKL